MKLDEFRIKQGWSLTELAHRVEASHATVARRWCLPPGHKDRLVPSPAYMQKIVDVHYPDIKTKLVSESLKVFYELREIPGLKKKPSTSELLDWLKLLMNEDITPEMLREKNSNNIIPPLHGALLKNEQDVHLFERLAFLARREDNQN